MHGLQGVTAVLLLIELEFTMERTNGRFGSESVRFGASWASPRASLYPSFEI